MQDFYGDIPPVMHCYIRKVRPKVRPFASRPTDRTARIRYGEDSATARLPGARWQSVAA